MNPVCLLAAPAEPGLDRVALRGQVLAVEVEADLEPQGVAGAEPARRRPRRRAAPPRSPGRPRGRSAARPRPRRCSRCRRPAPGGRRPARPRPASARGSSTPESLGDDAARLRALHGEHRVAVGDVADATSNRAGARPSHSRSVLVVGGVGDRQVAIVAEPVGEEVVDDAAVLVGQSRSTGRRRSRSPTTSLDSSPAGTRRACGPSVSTSPMWETSKTPQHGCAPRGAPARIPSYCDRHLPAREGHQLRARGACGARTAGCRFSEAAVATRSG